MQLTRPRTRSVGRPTRREAGFTLIELLLVVVILGFITVPLGNVVLGIIDNTDATSQRLALSHDAQISTAYFAQDVAGVGTHDLSVSAAPLKASIQLNAAYDAGPTCGSASTPVATVRFLSDDYDTASPPVRRVDVVAYVVESVGGQQQLHRIRCVGSASPVSDIVLAHYVVPASLSVQCDGQSLASKCTAAAVPKVVALGFTVTNPAAGSYAVSLSGQRRQT